MVKTCLKKYFTYLFLERGEEREKEEERNINVREDTSISCLSHAPSWGPGPQPRHVPQLGAKPVNFGFVGWHSIH